MLLLYKIFLQHGRQIINMKEEEPWPILKKNYCISTSTKLPSLTPLEKDIKSAVKAISKQPASENATYLYENKALVSSLHPNLQIASYKTTSVAWCVPAETSLRRDKCLHDLLTLSWLSTPGTNAYS